MGAITAPLQGGNDYLPAGQVVLGKTAMPCGAGQIRIVEGCETHAFGGGHITPKSF